MKSRQRVLPDSLFIHSSSITLSFAWSFSRSSGNAVVACSKISSSILRAHSERTDGRAGEGGSFPYLVSFRSRGFTFSSRFQYVCRREKTGGQGQNVCSVSVPPCDRNERLTCACSTAFTANLHAPENQQPSADTEPRPAHSLFFDLQQRGRSLSPWPGVSKTACEGAHLDEILRVVRVELGRHFCCVCGVRAAGRTRKSERGERARVSWQGTERNAERFREENGCASVFELRAGLCCPAGARVKRT